MDPPLVGLAVKVTLEPLQMVLPAPEAMETEGVTEEVVVTLSVRAGLVPQAFEAVTEMVPDAAPAVVVMELVDEVPLHPEGNVQA